MTRKHFVAFAEEIKDKVLCAQQIIQEGKGGSVALFNEAEFAASVVCRVASRDNPRFDRNVFMRACGLQN